MPDTKVFDKADLLAIYDASREHGDLIGDFQSRRLIGELPRYPVYETHEVYATTTASFSEKNLWLIVEHGIHITNVGIGWLAHSHAYRKPDFGSLTIERGLSNSADIMRKVMAMANDWRNEVEADCPSGILEAPGRSTEQPDLASASPVENSVEQPEPTTTEQPATEASAEEATEEKPAKRKPAAKPKKGNRK